MAVEQQNNRTRDAVLPPGEFQCNVFGLSDVEITLE